MRRGAHEGEEIVRRMELTLPCGLRPDCNAVTVAVEAPEGTNVKTKSGRTSISDGEQDRIAREQHRNDITSRDTEVQNAHTAKHDTATLPRPVLMLVAIFLKIYVADTSG